MADSSVRHGMSIRWVRITIATLAFVLAQSLTVAAQESGAVDDAIRFRRSVGLETDRTFVHSTFNRDEYSADEFGVPLSKDEIALIEKRQSRTAKAAPGHEWANEQPDFAGAWTDQSRDGLIVYQFSANVAAAREELARLLPSEVKYEVVRVDRDLDALRRLKRSIAADVPALDATGTEVVSIGLDIRDNTVRVGVAENVSRARDTIQSTYGDFVKVASEDRGHADCAGLRNCSPLKGGIRVFDVPGDGDCTAGYVAKKPNGRLVLVTAGHCIRIGEDGNVWKHRESGDPQGTADEGLSEWCCATSSNPGADIGVFQIYVAEEPTHKNRVIMNNANPATVDKIRADLADWAPQQGVGEIVCRMGHGSIDQDDGHSGYTAKKCGAIQWVDTERKSVYPGYADRWVDHLNVWEGDSTGGDSGGTVFVDVPGQSDEVYLLGTHVHSSNDNDGADGNSWYEPVAQGIWEILDRFGVLLDPCTLDDPC